MTKRFAFLVVWALGTMACAAVARRPNILMIVVDDMGYGDLSAHGHPWLKTPNFDRLHAQSLRMTDFLVSPTCSPTRAALMTGAHEFRSGVTHTIFGMERMNEDCTTLAQVISGAGYHTGMFGKWHLGDEGGHVPWKRGFEVGVIAENDAKAAAHQRPVDPVFYFNGEKRQMKGVRDLLFAKEAMSFMGVDREDPFFCYFATYDPHNGHWATERFMNEMERQVQAAREKGILGVNERRLGFFAEVLQTDWILGEMMSFLDQKGLAGNTLVLLVTDNGGTDGVDAYNAGMRGHKTTAWLGGTRALAFWRWPGVLTPGELSESCAHIDVLPTLAQVAGASLDKLSRQVEGRSAWGMMTGGTKAWPERSLFAHVARWDPGMRDLHKYRGAMVRRGRYDLVRDEKGSMGRAYTDRPEFHRARSPGGGWGLYDRLADPLEEHDLSSAMPDLVTRLRAEYEQWWMSSRKNLIHEVGGKD